MEGGNAYALTVPLITKADGNKFGKTEGGSVWLDPDKTSPYAFYQFWLNVSDEDASRYIRIFTTLDKEAIEGLEAAHAEAPHQRILQKAIAKDITIMVHSEAEYEMALKASALLFGKSTTEDLTALDERTFLQVFEGVPQILIERDAFQQTEKLVDLLADHDGVIFSSKREARKLIQGGGVSINKIRVDSPNSAVDFPLLQDRYLLVQKGKKNYFIIRID